MAQHDYILANQSGAAFRSDLNNGLAAIVSQNSGAAQPSTTYAYQWWADTTTGLLKIRNAANNAWITLFQLDGEWTTLALENGTAAAPSLYFKDSGTDTGLFSPGANQLAISTGGVQRLLADASGNLTASGGLTVANLNGGPLAGTRNRIINGDMRIDQRSAGASGTANGVYTVDRWNFGSAVASKLTWGQNYNSLTPPAGFTTYMGYKTTTAYTVGASEFFLHTQEIEGYNVSDLAFGTASAKSFTISFWVNSSLTGTFGVTFLNSAQNRCYPATYTISSANTWEYKTITIAGDTSGTWLTTNGKGLTVIFGLGVGSTYSGTAGSWQSSTLSGATGATSVVGTLNATWNITGVQLEPGTVATPFERRSYGQELALCQRYFEAGNGDCVSYAASGAAIQRFTQNFVVLKRTTATVAISKISGDATSIAVSSVFGNLNGFSYNIVSTSSSETLQSYWTASAEL
jgi:hypothetical protein